MELLGWPVWPAIVAGMVAILLAVILTAAEAPVIPATAATVAAPAPDPSAAIVAEGRCTYRQRDLDALVLVAQRHLRDPALGGPARLQAGDDERLRAVVLTALTAREPLLAALAGLPAATPARARDALVLDLLDWLGEPRLLAGPATAAPSAPLQAGPVVVRLPPLALVRRIEGGARRLRLGLALALPDAAAATALEPRAPLLQDAVLGCLHALPPAEFAAPDWALIKGRLATAIVGRIPELPAASLLVTELESEAE